MKQTLKISVLISILLFSAFYLLIPGSISAQQTNPYSCPSAGRPTLALNSTGNCVRHLQWYLNRLSSANLAEDGIFGPLTRSAVRTYQQQNNLTVDGIVGFETWSSIENRASSGGTQSGSSQQLPGYNLPPLPTGSGYTQGEIEGLLIKFANFLIAAGVILGVITLVVSGIMYFRAGSDTDAKKGKAWFKNGITGAFIILAVGVIILTIYNIVVDRTFFGGPTIPGPVPVSGALGSPCQTDINCDVGLKCKRTGIFGTGPKTCQQP